MRVFRLALANISHNNSLFEGSVENHIVQHNVDELQGMSYLVVGRLLAMYGQSQSQILTII